MSAKHVDQVSKMANLVSNLPIAHKLTQIVQHINTKYPNFRPCFDPKWNAEIGDKELKLNLQNIGCYLVAMMNQTSPKTKKKVKTPFVMKCHFCSKKGHKWRDCRLRKRNCPAWTPEKKNDENGYAADWDAADDENGYAADWDGDWVDDPNDSNWF